MMTEKELCNADNKLQRNYDKGIISLAKCDFAKNVLHKEWSRITRKKEVLDKLEKKYDIVTEEEFLNKLKKKYKNV